MDTLDADLAIVTPHAAPPKRSRALPRDRINGQPGFVLHSYPYK
jgi:DNA repair protein RecO (recombination protein O)